MVDTLGRAVVGDLMLFLRNVDFHSVSFLKSIKISYKDNFKLATDFLSIN
jgi:hypothetical protein